MLMTGFIMDEKLTSAEHIKVIKAEMTHYIGDMYKLKGLLPVSSIFKYSKV